METSLFKPQELPPPVQYDLLFENLPLLPEKKYRTGRPGFSPNSLLKGLIYKALRGIPTLSELSFEIHLHSGLRPVLGLSLYKAGPLVERFSHFLQTCDNSILQQIRRQLLLKLIAAEALKGEIIALDSCPIPIQAKQNNLKTSAKNRFEKSQILPKDPQARLGFAIHFPQPFKKKMAYFWGYRNHALIDADTELPLWEITSPANVHETVVAIELLRETIESLKLKPKIVLGDANYDVEKILGFIVNDMHALPIIPRNPRRTIGENYFIQENKIYCLAGLVMYRKGKMRNKKSAVLYCQYSCPLNYGKERKNYLVCPVFHEKFFKGKGCNVLIRLEPSVRQNIPYDTEFFKTEYRKRTAVERIFSRLLSIAMQEPTVVGLNAISNHATIAHIAVLLVALTAYKNGYKDKIRFVKSFVPKFL